MNVTFVMYPKTFQQSRVVAHVKFESTGRRTCVSCWVMLPAKGALPLCWWNGWEHETSSNSVNPGCSWIPYFSCISIYVLGLDTGIHHLTHYYIMFLKQEKTKSQVLAKIKSSFSLIFLLYFYYYKNAQIFQLQISTYRPKILKSQTHLYQNPYCS